MTAPTRSTQPQHPTATQNTGLLPFFAGAGGTDIGATGDVADGPPGLAKRSRAPAALGGGGGADGFGAAGGGGGRAGGGGGGAPPGAGGGGGREGGGPPGVWARGRAPPS